MHTWQDGVYTHARQAKNGQSASAPLLLKTKGMRFARSTVPIVYIIGT